MRTESDPVKPKVSIPSKTEGEKQLYYWRTDINNFYEGCEYVDWIEGRCRKSTSEGAVPSQGAIPNQFAIVNVAAIEQAPKLVASSGCGRSLEERPCLVTVFHFPVRYCFRSQSQQKRAALWLWETGVLHSDYHVCTHRLLILNLVFQRKVCNPLRVLPTTYLLWICFFKKW